MPSNKYLSKWSGENIDHAYEVVRHLNSNQADKIAYIDSEGNLKATSFKKESIGIVNTLDWNSEPAYNFAIKDVNGKISLSSYNSYSFISYNDSLSSGNNPSGNLAYFTTFTVGNVTKYYIEDTGISVVQVTTALGKVAELETQLAAALTTIRGLTSRIESLEAEKDKLYRQGVMYRDDTIYEINIYDDHGVYLGSGIHYDNQGNAEVVGYADGTARLYSYDGSKQLIIEGSDSDLEQRLEDEIRNRQDADDNLQSQIDSIAGNYIRVRNGS